jgi:hypothetical protein
LLLLLFEAVLTLMSKQTGNRRMASSGMLRRVALVRTDVSEELSASFVRVTRNGELGTTLVVTNNRRTLVRRSLQEPHGITSQMTPFFIVTAVITSNLTNWQPSTRKIIRFVPQPKLHFSLRTMPVHITKRHIFYTKSEFSNSAVVTVSQPFSQGSLQFMLSTNKCPKYDN